MLPLVSSSIKSLHHQPIDRLKRRPVTARDGVYVRLNGRWLLNFASTNYLGMATYTPVEKAICKAAQSWGSSMGMPRSLAEDGLTLSLETALARLVGQDRALIFPSTSHIALDVLSMLAGRQGLILIDEGAYPISLQGAYAAQNRGARLIRFCHQDPQSLYRALRRNASAPKKVIVCDGVYGAESQVAPLAKFDHLAYLFDAVLYIDDAHGIGLLGRNPSKKAPYGRGGGGTPQFLALNPGKFVHVASLGKAFGLPLALIAGPANFIETLRVKAPTFSHSSPPAIPLVAGALAALKVNHMKGDKLRSRLLAAVARFRRNLRRADIQLASRFHLPVQSIFFANPKEAAAAQWHLRQAGILAVFQQNPLDRSAGAVIQFVITADHNKTDIDRATSAIVSVDPKFITKVQQQL